MFKNLRKSLEENNAKVCIVGTGYVGLPLIVGFAESGLECIGFDLNKEKIEKLKRGIDSTGELTKEKLLKYIDSNHITFTSDEDKIKKADFVILCIPTPIKENKEPDLSYVENAGIIVGRNLKKGSIIILESTVYPGVTEEALKPILENESRMICGKDFSLGYSPERVNPGDAEHSMKSVVKVVSGIDIETSYILEKLYKRVALKGVFKARDIKTAEAAKVIENIQRDLNIALVNELSIIFGKMGIDILDVLRTAETKWNFHPYKPGLVGGHCIPVDPYYLVFKSKQLGYKPKVILTGREINDSMPIYITEKALEYLKRKNLNESKVLLLGLTFKKNVRDTRNAPVKKIIMILSNYGVKIFGFDPLLLQNEIKEGFGIVAVKNIHELKDIDVIITVTNHDVISKNISPDSLKKISKKGTLVLDARRVFKPNEIRKFEMEYMI